jgi:hypothetical protein
VADLATIRYRLTPGTTNYLLWLDIQFHTRYSGCVFKGGSEKLTLLTPQARYFLHPSNPTHRQYEALRAYFVEGLASAEAARRFGYSPGSFRVLCHQFRAYPTRAFFLPPAKGPASLDSHVSFLT